MIQSKQVLGIATSSISSSKLRSALTILGIMIGVAAVITNVSIGASFNQYFTDSISSIGSNFIFVYSSQPNLFFENELELVKNIPGIIGVSPRKQTTGELSYLFETRNVDVLGVEEEFQRIQGIQMEEGSFIKNQDRYAVVLGHDVANEHFGRKISHRNSVNIAFRQKDGTKVEKTFKVKGTIQKSITGLGGKGSETDSLIFIPISTLNEMTGEKDYSQFFAMADSPESVSKASSEVDRRLARNFGVQKKDLENKNAKPYGIVDQTEILKEIGQVGDSLSAFLFAVAMISLVVGSKGIMNII